MRPRVALRVEELVLHGFPPADRYRIAGALARELERLIAEGGVPAAWLSANGAAVLEGGSFAMPPGARPEAVGRSIAGALYHGQEGGGVRWN